MDSLVQLFRVGSGFVSFLGYTFADSPGVGSVEGDWLPPPGSGQLLNGFLQLPNAQAVPPLSEWGLCAGPMKFRPPALCPFEFELHRLSEIDHKHLPS